MVREIFPLSIIADRRDTSLTGVEPLGMLEIGRKTAVVFSYPPRTTTACGVVIDGRSCWYRAFAAAVLKHKGQGGLR